MNGFLQKANPVLIAGGLWIVIGAVQVAIALVFGGWHPVFGLEVLFLAGCAAGLWIAGYGISTVPLAWIPAFGYRHAALFGIVCLMLMVSNRYSYAATQFEAGPDDVVVLALLSTAAFAGFKAKPLTGPALLFGLIPVATAVATGRREWLLLTGLAALTGLISAIKRPVQVLAFAGLVFVVASAGMLMLRTVRISPEKTGPFAEEVASALQKIPARIAASKVHSKALHDYALRSGGSGLSAFFREQSKMLVPRFLNPDKPSLRPGETVYRIVHNGAASPKQESYPASPAGWWLLVSGLQAWFFAPLFGFVWFFVIGWFALRSPALLGPPLAVLALNTEIPLPFWLTAGLRWALIFGMGAALMNVLRARR